MRTALKLCLGVLALAFVAACEGLPASPPAGPAAAKVAPLDEPSIAFVCFLAEDEDSGQLFRVSADGRAVQPLAPDVRDARVPAWSPDGGWIAFQADKHGWVWALANFEGDEEVYRVAPDGSHLQQLTDNWGDDARPVWSPDGRWIAFAASDPFAGWSVFRMRADGGERAQLTAGLDTGASLAWSPDSAWIAFTTTEDDGTQRLDAVRPDGSSLRHVAADASIDALAWSGDGRWIAYDSTDAVRVRVRPDGSGTQFLQTPAAGPPTWSSQRPPPAVEHPARTRKPVALLDPATFDVADSIAVPADAGPLTFSPDRAWVAFSSKDAGDGLSFAEIFKMRLDGSGLQRLTNMDCNATEPAWSPTK